MWSEPGFNIYGKITTKTLKYLNEVDCCWHHSKSYITKVKAPFEIQQEGNVSVFLNPTGELSQLADLALITAG